MVPAPPSPSASPFSEDGILACLARHFPQTHASLLLGRGDDCAVLKAGRPLCVSSDLFLEDIHFRRSYFSPEDMGHKALAVNVSDLAACGSRPLGFTLCLGLPDWVDMAWLEAFFSGMAALAGQQRMALAGGDLSRCRQLHICVTVWGETAEPAVFWRAAAACRRQPSLWWAAWAWREWACICWRLAAAMPCGTGPRPAPPICGPNPRWTRA